MIDTINGITIYGIEAAARSEIVAIGSRRGHFDEVALREVGAAARSADVAALLADIEQSPAWAGL